MFNHPYKISNCQSYHETSAMPPVKVQPCTRNFLCVNPCSWHINPCLRQGNPCSKSSLEVLKYVAINIRNQNTVKWSKVENVGGVEGVDGDGLPTAANDPQVRASTAMHQVGVDVSLQVVVLVEAN